VPRGRLAEDGRISDRYEGLVEAATADYAERTRLNVRDSDATLIVSHGPLTGGSRVTMEEAQRLRRPALHLDLSDLDGASAVIRLRVWLQTEQPRVLNVAGPRASGDARIYSDVAAILRAALVDG
jgi:hypothetical protein